MIEALKNQIEKNIICPKIISIEDFIQEISERYILLYTEITGLAFQKEDQNDMHNRIFNNVNLFLSHV